jgi:hypothetical protein
MDMLIKVLGFVGLIIFLAVLFAFPTMWIVNCLFTPATLMALFGVAKLTFFKALMLNTICATLFQSGSSGSK